MDRDLYAYLPEQLRKEATPESTAEEMAAMIPDEVIQNINSKYLDISCKTGVFLIKIRDRIMKENKTLLEMFPEGKERERRKYIDEHNILYGISWIKEYVERSRVNLYGKVTTTGNIYCVPKAENDKGKLVEAYKVLVAAKDNGKLFNDTIKEICEMQFKTDMNFDVVIGNPPYNGGMDIDFVFKAFQLCTKYTIMITPAKCFTAEATQKISSQHSYGDFRKEIVPHMKQVCFYPDCKEIFDIMQADGITYYIIDKNNIHEECKVVNKMQANKIVNSTVSRNITNRTILFNVGDEIIDYILKYKKDIKSYKFSQWCNDRFQVRTNNHAPGGALYAYSSNCSSVYIIGISYVVDSEEYKNELPGLEFCDLPKDATLVFSADTKEKCESFVSWLNTKFVRFFVAMNISKLAPMMCDYCFRYVPEPLTKDGVYDWSLVYSDELLYEYFGLNKPEAQTKEGIRYKDIIESLIKER